MGRRQKMKSIFAIRGPVAAAVGTAALFGFCAQAMISGNGASSAPAPQPLTVRSLLEGPEVVEAATDNYMAMHGYAVSREVIGLQIARGFQNISQTIRHHLPEAHTKLGELRLSGAQKDTALSALRKLGDARMVTLSLKIAKSVHESKMAGAGADDEGAKRRLVEELLPNLVEMQGLSQELPPIGQWHTQIQVDLGDAATARRLSTADELSGVRAQAQTLLHSLKHQLGDDMPSAPSRMLLSSSDPSSSGEQSFMSCCMAAVPNPMEVAQCMASNMGEVMKMMTSFMKGGR